MDRLASPATNPMRLADLGCGNGELWRQLKISGYRGLYVGLDFSPQLLETAMAGEKKNQEERRFGDSLETTEAQAIFLQADLSTADWDTKLLEKPFDITVAFSVLHHLPGYVNRLEVLRKVHRLLALDGRFFHSEWQFLSSERLRSRIQPWEVIGLSAELVDPGDYLLDWRHQGYGLRYVHHFDEAELSDLAEESGFRITKTFLSDGENGKSGLYQKWIVQ